MTAVIDPVTTGEPALWKLVGNTPLLPVVFPEIAADRLWLKAEWLNPGGSVKDRTARAILRDGLRRGELPRRRLLDASSGIGGDWLQFTRCHVVRTYDEVAVAIHRRIRAGRAEHGE